MFEDSVLKKKLAACMQVENQFLQVSLKVKIQMHENHWKEMQMKQEYGQTKFITGHKWVSVDLYSIF